LFTILPLWGMCQSDVELGILPWTAQHARYCIPNSSHVWHRCLAFHFHTVFAGTSSAPFFNRTFCQDIKYQNWITSEIWTKKCSGLACVMCVLCLKNIYWFESTKIKNVRKGYDILIKFFYYWLFNIFIYLQFTFKNSMFV
jgi:hypothetical protein